MGKRKLRNTRKARKVKNSDMNRRRTQTVCSADLEEQNTLALRAGVR
jgi:hypothetical protein